MRKERENWPKSKKLKRLLHHQKDLRREEPLKSLDGSLMEPRDVSNKAPCQGLTGGRGSLFAGKDGQDKIGKCDILSWTILGNFYKEKPWSVGRSHHQHSASGSPDEFSTRPGYYPRFGVLGSKAIVVYHEVCVLSSLVFAPFSPLKCHEKPLLAL